MKASAWYKNPAVITALCILLVAVLAYLTYENFRLKKQLDDLSATHEMLSASSTEALAFKETEVTQLAELLEITTEERDDLERDLRREQDRNDDFENQIEEIAGTVGVLDKLSKTDRELLQKYSRVYFLNENYRPGRLTEIPTEYVLSGRQTQFFHTEAWPYLRRMLEDAEDDGIDLKVTSAFRSFEEQAELKGQYTQTYGSGANAFSADQGYSEHQLGTTADLTTPAIGGPYNSFAQTEAYRWLLENAHTYGFILSYPEGNIHYVYEPWHWRFVGTELAEHMHDEGINFYDMDQREINEYLVSIFD